MDSAKVALAYFEPQWPFVGKPFFELHKQCLQMFKELEEIANEKGIRVQTLVRAVIIPEWVQKAGLSMAPILKPAKGPDVQWRKT